MQGGGARCHAPSCPGPVSDGHDKSFCTKAVTIIDKLSPGLGKIDCNRLRYSLLFVHRMHWSLYFLN